MVFEAPKHSETEEENDSGVTESREAKKEREITGIREDSMTLT